MKVELCVFKNGPMGLEPFPDQILEIEFDAPPQALNRSDGIVWDEIRYVVKRVEHDWDRKVLRLDVLKWDVVKV